MESKCDTLYNEILFSAGKKLSSMERHGGNVKILLREKGRLKMLNAIPFYQKIPIRPGAMAHTCYHCGREG